MLRCNICKHKNKILNHNHVCESCYPQIQKFYSNNKKPWIQTSHKKPEPCQCHWEIIKIIKKKYNDCHCDKFATVANRQFLQNPSSIQQYICNCSLMTIDTHYIPIHDFDTCHIFNQPCINCHLIIKDTPFITCYSWLDILYQLNNNTQSYFSFLCHDMIGLIVQYFFTKKDYFLLDFDNYDKKLCFNCHKN